jgi:hypothetical protein
MSWRTTYNSTLPVEPSLFANRHEPVLPIHDIGPENTYYLGYIVQKDIENRLARDPQDPTALADREAMRTARDHGIRNQEAYLVSDHLDVYIATSMRRRHEYIEAAKFTNEVFNHGKIRELKTSLV